MVTSVEPNSTAFEQGLKEGQVITAIDGIGSFNEAYKNIDKIKYGKMKINFIGFNDLIINKKATNRLQDQRDIKELERVRKKKNYKKSKGR